MNPLVETDITKVRLRRNERFRCDVAGSARVGRWAGRRSVRARVLDYSQTGALVELSEALPAGSRLRLHWRDPGSGRRLAMAATVTREAGEGRRGLAFDKTIREAIYLHGDGFRRAMALSGAAAAGSVILMIKSQNIYWFWHSPVLALYSLVASSFVMLRLIISVFYRQPKDNRHYPTVSVCITAKNEEDNIAETIHSCFASRYPAELFEVIAVDDGSTDKTWEKMEECKPRYGDRLTLVRFPENKGKRHAMAAGAEAAKGEILLYVDSDTFLDPEGMYRIMQPFVDPQVGAAAGHILVDIEDNFISKMESVRYYASHRINKAGEGVFGAVTCCSGAFSAYRRKAVMEVLQAWLNQKFLGVQATFGDDRSLTNYVLQRYRIVYHDGARARTKVPSYWMKFFRQQLRWKKSWSRETLVAVRFMYREHPIAALQYYLGVFLTLMAPFIVTNSVVLNPLMRDGSGFHYVAGLVLTYLFMTLVCLYHTRTRYWAYGLSFALLYVCVLAWQNYYAMLTINKTKWGTR